MTTLFDKIYILNLDSRFDRWNFISNHLLEVGLDNFERVSSTQLTIDSTISKTKLAEISCFHSHLKTLRKAYESNLNKILILEDDCKFIKKIDDNISNIIKQVNQDLLYLGCNRKIYKNNASLIYLSDVKKINDYLYEVDECGTAHAIVYNKDVIKKIIDYYPTDEIFFERAFSLEESHSIYDIYINTFARNNNIKKYCIFPILCTQIDSYSNIQFYDASYEKEILNSWNQL